MSVITSPRHTRRGFIGHTKRMRGFAASIHAVANVAEKEEAPLNFHPDFATQSSLSLLSEQIKSEYTSLDCRPTPIFDEFQVSQVLKKLENSISHVQTEDLRSQAGFDSNYLPAHSHKFVTEPQFSPEIVARFDEPARATMNVHVEILPNKNRIESYNNGSLVVKNPLGRVIEVRSKFGDCLFLEYGQFGRLETFTRLDSKGLLHSSCQRSKHGIAVRDKDGRVSATGESIVCDSWGCLYLHGLDGQYFCLDLVGGIHSERRRLLNEAGKIEYLTAVFTHDGFRMSTLYAVRQSLSPSKISMKRHTIYRFYGRDGTMLEFPSEAELKGRSPNKALPPGSRTVDPFWLKHPQAQTAWESLQDYLTRVS